MYNTLREQMQVGGPCATAADSQADDYNDGELDGFTAHTFTDRELYSQLEDIEDALRTGDHACLPAHQTAHQASGVGPPSSRAGGAP